MELNYVGPMGHYETFGFYSEITKDLLEESEKRLVWYKLVINRSTLSDALKIVSIEKK